MKRKKITRNIIGFGIFFVLSILGIFGFFGKLSNYVGKPIWSTEKFVNDSLYNINYFVRTKESVSNENHNLIEEISSIRMSMIDYKILKDENIKLKEILGRMEIKNDFILGNILTKPNHSPYDTIIIDIGKNMGINEGDLVYANGNIPIGVIGNIYDNTSLVSLYTNPGQKTEGFIDGLNSSVTLTGRGGGNFEMIIPIELIIEKGTIIYLPSNTALVVAFVDEVISEPSDPFKKVLLSSPINIQSLKWVQVKKNKNESY